MQFYRLLTGPDDATFCHKVSEALSKGWVLHGSPSLSFDAKENAMVCAQAVVKNVPGAQYDPSLKLSKL